MQFEAVHDFNPLTNGEIELKQVSEEWRRGSNKEGMEWALVPLFHEMPNYIGTMLLPDSLQIQCQHRNLFQFATNFKFTIVAHLFIY